MARLRRRCFAWSAPRKRTSRRAECTPLIPSQGGSLVSIRCYEPGDENAQVAIYNEAAGPLPKFKPATLDEVRRRCRAADFDPSTRFYAVEGDRPVGYV